MLVNLSQMGQNGLLHHLQSSSDLAVFPWALSCWSAGISYSLGDLLFISCSKQHCLPVPWVRPVLCTFSVPRWVGSEEQSGGHGPGSEVQPSRCHQALPGLTGTKAQFWAIGACVLGAVPGTAHPGLAALCAAPRKFPGTEVAVWCCLTFPKTISCIFQSW